MEEKEKSIDELLNKYVDEEKKDVMKEKLSIISQIIAETERHIEGVVKKKVKAAEERQKAQAREFDVIKRANAEYFIHTSSLRSAMPATEEELKQDISDLKDAISMLEDLDQSIVDFSIKKVDVGLGMFYDKMTRRFKDIINEQNLIEYRFIPSERFKYHAFLNIKNIKNSDILQILNIMKETNLLSEIIEINSTFHLIVFTDGEIRFSNPEKVILTFAYEEEILTTQKLIELTEWKEDYARRIIEGLIHKGIITVKDGIIGVLSFGHYEERKKWNNIIQIQIQKEKEREEAKFKRQLERRKQLQKLLEEKEETQIQKEEVPPPVLPEPIIDGIDDAPSSMKNFELKPSIHTLPSIDKEKLKEAQEIKDKDALLGAMEALDQEAKFNGSIAPQSQEISSISESLDVDDEERDLEDLIPEKILNFHERYSLINGGFAQYEKIRNFVQLELERFGEVPEDLIIAMLSQLKELQMIQNMLKMGDYEFILFQDIKLNFLHRRFITLAVGKKPLKKEDFMEALRWDEEKVLNTMKELQEFGIMKLENDEIIIPGIIQERASETFSL